MLRPKYKNDILLLLSNSGFEFERFEIIDSVVDCLPAIKIIYNNSSLFFIIFYSNADFESFKYQFTEYKPGFPLTIIRPDSFGARFLDVHMMLDRWLRTHVYMYYEDQNALDFNELYNSLLLQDKFKKLTKNLLEKNLDELKGFPESSKLLKSALQKLNEKKYERNILDDLRLCLETLIKNLLKNKKSLENQTEPLGLFLKNRGTSKEFTNMLLTMIDYFSKYQNNYVKHNDNVKQSEVQLLINLSSSFISFLTDKTLKT